jgi:hypothetical protein
MSSNEAAAKAAAEAASTGKADAVMVPGSTSGAPDMGGATGATKMMGGGLILTPLPLEGGRRRSRKVSKKVLKMLKKMGPAKVAKLLKKKGGQEEMAEEPVMEGGRRRKTRRGGRRHSRKLY